MMGDHLCRSKSSRHGTSNQQRRSTQRSILRGMVKRILAFQPRNNKLQWWSALLDDDDDDDIHYHNDDDDTAIIITLF